MAFHVGQKVEKWRQGPRRPFSPGDAIPIPVGTRLTIRAVQTYRRMTGEVVSGLLFEEVRNRVLHHGYEIDYFVGNFRPITERKTDISIFREILDRESGDAPVKTPKKERV